METKQLLKSRTINFNALAALAISLLPYFHVIVTPELTALIFGISNILLRFMTDKPIQEK